MRNLCLLLISSLLLLVGCATRPHQQFDKVKVGMEKDEVLGIMDSPQRTQRWHGMDRWTYIYYDQAGRQEKEVHFSEGKANYVGEVFKPEVSAEEQDSRNEAANKEVESYAQSRKDDVRKSFSDYEKHAQGQDSIRYVPQFVPVK